MKGAGRLVLTDVARTYRGSGRFLRRGADLRAVDGVSLVLEPGETLGLVGESGSGKSTLGRIAAGIERPSAGSVTLDGRPFAPIGSATWRRERRAVQMVFQNPSRVLDPRMRIERQIGEALTAHGVSGAEEIRRTLAMLDLVGLDGLGSRLPHQLSGGQQQRAAIARALVLGPRVLVCDEVVSALDVSVQAQILNLLTDLKAQFAVGTLFISHDLGVVRHVSDRIAVMHRGAIVEIGAADTVFGNPRHDYTRALLAAVPASTPAERRARLSRAA